MRVARVQGQHLVEGPDRGGGVARRQQLLAARQLLLDPRAAGGLLLQLALFGENPFLQLSDLTLRFAVQLRGCDLRLSELRQRLLELVLREERGGFLDESPDLGARQASRFLALAVDGLGAELAQLGVGARVAHRPAVLGDVEHPDRRGEVLLVQIAEAEVVVGEVVLELQAVRPLLQARRGLDLYRGEHVLDGFVVFTIRDLLVAGLQVVVVPLADGPGRRGCEDEDATRRGDRPKQARATPRHPTSRSPCEHVESLSPEKTRRKHALRHPRNGGVLGCSGVASRPSPGHGRDSMPLAGPHVTSGDSLITQGGRSLEELEQEKRPEKPTDPPRPSSPSALHRAPVRWRAWPPPVHPGSPSRRRLCISSATDRGLSLPHDLVSAPRAGAPAPIGPRWQGRFHGVQVQAVRTAET